MKKKNNYASTFVRYFISYFVVLCLLLTGFVVMMQFQLTNIYTRQLHNDIEQRLDIVQEQFSSNISAVTQTHQQLRSSTSLSVYRRYPDVYNQIEFHRDMRKYDSSNDFINSIIYINKKEEAAFSTGYYVDYIEDVCYINNIGGQCSTFNLKELEEKGKNVLHLLQNGDVSYFIFFPNNTSADYALLYLIDYSTLSKLLKNNMINGMNAFAVIDTVDSHMIGVHPEQITELIGESEVPSENGIYTYDNTSESLYVREKLYENYSLVTLFSQDALSQEMNDTFRTAYIMLLMIGLAGFLTIFLSMKLTYFPLAKLAKKIIPAPETSQDFIAQLDNAFSASANEKEMLQQKIQKYHLSIQNALLDTSIHDSDEANFTSIKNIDQIFLDDCDNCIYLLRVHSEDAPIPDIRIIQYLMSVLPKPSGCIVLESASDYSVYIINYISAIPDKDSAAYMLAMDLHHEYGLYCAISNSASSLTDIPAMYENALFASNAWPDIPVATYTDILGFHPDITDSLYPYKQLDYFSESLENSDFMEAQELLLQLLAQLEQLLAPDSHYPDFIIRCLLIDILMTLFSALNRHDIKFKVYNDLYFETLYYCRSFNWQEKKREITDNLLKMLTLFQDAQHTVRTNQIQEYIEEHFASEDISITMLADHFQVNAVYMSALFKKEFNENFVDYIWRLRFEKASDLLLHTDMSIELISNQVGYINTSSFCRKFKQKTGMSPSQYRATDGKNGEK